MQISQATLATHYKWKGDVAEDRLLAVTEQLFMEQQKTVQLTEELERTKERLAHFEGEADGAAS